MDERLKRLLIWIAANSEKESRFLTPEPEWKVDSDDLFKEIVAIYELNEIDITDVIDPYHLENTE